MIYTGGVPSATEHAPNCSRIETEQDITHIEAHCGGKKGDIT